MINDIRNEVQSLYTHLILTTIEALICGVDFIGIRVRLRMQEILHRFYPDSPPPTHIPVICLIEPPIIQSDSTTQAQSTPTPEPLGSCTETMWFSEKTGSVFCPEGYVLRGLDCSGSYCDNKSMYCCPSKNRDDPDGRTSWTGWFYEERPIHLAISAAGFVAGMKCEGSYCDNITLFMIAIQNLFNVD